MKKADRLRLNAALARAKERHFAALAEAYERQMRELETDDHTGETPLRSSDERVIDRHVGQAEILTRYRQQGRQPGRPVESDHPFSRALADAGVTMQGWARAHGLSRTRVRSWIIDGTENGGRRIDRKYAEEIRREFKVPLSAWSNGVKD